jgi:hypothetical protein
MYSHVLPTVYLDDHPSSPVEVLTVGTASRLVARAMSRASYHRPSVRKRVATPHPRRNNANTNGEEQKLSGQGDGN